MRASADRFVLYEVTGWRDIRDLAKALQPLEESGVSFKPFSLLDGGESGKVLVLFIDDGDSRAAECDGPLCSSAGAHAFRKLSSNGIRFSPTIEPWVLEARGGSTSGSNTEAMQRIAARLGDVLREQHRVAWGQLCLFRLGNCEEPGKARLILLALLSGVALELENINLCESVRFSRYSVDSLVLASSGETENYAKAGLSGDSQYGLEKGLVVEPLGEEFIHVTPYEMFLYEEPSDYAYATPSYLSTSSNTRFGRFVRDKVLRKQATTLSSLKSLDSSSSSKVKVLLEALLRPGLKPGMTGILSGDSLRSYCESLAGQKFSPEEVAQVEWMFRRCYDQDNRPSLRLLQYLHKPVSEWVSDSV